MKSDKNQRKLMYEYYTNGVLFKDLRKQFCVDSSVFFNVAVDYYTINILGKTDITSKEK